MPPSRDKIYPHLHQPPTPQAASETTPILDIAKKSKKKGKGK